MLLIHYEIQIHEIPISNNCFAYWQDGNKFTPRHHFNAHFIELGSQGVNLTDCLNISVYGIEMPSEYMTQLPICLSVIRSVINWYFFLCTTVYTCAF